MAEKKKKEVYIIGHRNPDTDSICSAIALAYLKNQLAGTDGSDAGASKAVRLLNKEASEAGTVYIPRRAGHINQETAYVLKTFNMSAPAYLNDARSQVKDMDVRRIDGISSDSSLKQAWFTMSDVNMATLAVTDEKRHLKGIITTGDIAKSYMAVFDNKILADAHTPYTNILDVLDGTMAAGVREQVVQTGKVIIGTANIELLKQHLNQGDIVILGNRYEAQLYAIEAKVSCIIVCDGAKVSRTICKIAQDNGCAVIATPFDTYTVARLINQSIPISYFMVNEDMLTFKETEYIDDIKSVMTGKRFRDFPVVDKSDRFVGMISRRNLINYNKKQLILVDHNENGQAVFGIEEAEVIEIVDHHKLGTIETMKPISFRNQPLGCTATIVYQMFLTNVIEIPKNIAGLLCSAIISDTLLFRSPTCTQVDEAACRTLAAIAGIDLEAYAIEMFSAGSNLSAKTNEEIFYQDFKKFKTDEVELGIGQVTSMDKLTLAQLKERMLPYIEKARQKEGVDMMFLMLTDILQESTILLMAGTDAAMTVEKGFDVHVNRNMVSIEGMVSRKKQLVPVLLNALQS